MNTEIKRKSNKGFSLVEVIVVVAIMAIVGTMTIGGMYMIKKSNINGATKDIESSLEAANGYAKSRAGKTSYIEFYLDGKKLMSKTYLVRDNGTHSVLETKAYGSQIRLIFKDSNGTSVTVEDSKKLRFYINKRSGAIDKVAYVSGATETSVSNASSSYGDFTIEAARGNSDKKGRVTIYYQNGTLE